MTQTAIKTQKHITSPVVFRCYAKEDTKKERCIGYGVPSDKEGTYRVTYNCTLHRYECTCFDHLNRQHDCKHINAVIEVAEARRQETAQARERYNEQYDPCMVA